MHRILINKNKRNSLYTTTMIRRFSKERRNILRGVFVSASRDGLSLKHVNEIRNNVLHSDMSVAGAILNSQSGIRSRKIKRLLQKDILPIHSLRVRGCEAEIAYSCGYLNANPDDASNAIGTIALLSQILTVPSSDAVRAIHVTAQEWGASNYLAWKIAYAKTFLKLTSEDITVLESTDELLGHRDSPGIQYSALENLKPAISIFSIAQRHINTLLEHIDGDFRRSYSLNNFVSTPVSFEDCSAFILRATETSLIDTVHAIWIICNLSDRFPKAKEAIQHHLAPQLYELLEMSRAEISAAQNPDLVVNSDQNSTSKEDNSMSIYRRSAAFLEYSVLCRYRNDVDQVIGQRLLTSLMPPTIRRPAENFYQRNILQQPNGYFQLDKHREVGATIDTFYRTYLFLRYIQDPLNLSLLRTEDFQFIFDNTIGLEALLSEHEMRHMHLNASDEARPLIAILALSLYRNKSVDADIDFSFREQLESFILLNHEGNITSFIEQLTPRSPQVANYIAQSLDEVTLQKMYSIIDSPAKAAKTRYDILMTLGITMNKLEYIIEAESIETRGKVASLRKYFDSSRMYVDSIAMRKWLNSTPSAYAEQYKELLPKIMANLVSMGSIQGPKGEELQVNLLTFRSTDEHLVYQIVKEAFREFCINNEFGIESYLGRRIRHNTLQGVMTKCVDDVFQRDEYVPILSGTPFGRALGTWYNNYKLYIERMRKEYLQFKEISKPNALFESAIDPSDETTRRNILELVQALRVSGAEMLYDLVIAFCWKQIAPQLEFASNHIKVRMARDVIQGFDQAMSRFNGPEEKRIQSSLISEISGVFAQVAGWFQLPQTGFVSATVGELCNIIDDEGNRVSVRTVVRGDSLSTKYYGITVHRLYDCLAVLMQNAFKNGRPESAVQITVRSTAIEQTNLHQLQVSVLSQLPDDYADDCVDRVAAAINSFETARDMVTEGYTGIKKVKFITRLNVGHQTVTYTRVGNELEIGFALKAEISIDG